MSYLNSITTKGQITLPKAYRDRLGLDKAGKGHITFKDNAIVITVPPTAKDTRARLRAILDNPQGSDLNPDAQAIGNHLADKYGVNRR